VGILENWVSQPAASRQAGVEGKLDGPERVERLMR